MNRACRASCTAGLAVLLLSGLVPGASAEQVTASDREATYPAGVLNVTHEPWAPRAGQDVVVRLELERDAAVPNEVALLYCRVEPSYVCGLPFFMEAGDDGRKWTGTIAWDDERGAQGDEFFTSETTHVGYNVTQRFRDENGTLTRVPAPTGNYWVPDTYPVDSDGVYFFVAYSGSVVVSPPVSAWLAVAAVATLAVVARRHGDGA